MELKTFMMNYPSEDKEMVQDFVEGTLDVTVKDIELLRGAVLVTLETSVDLDAAAKKLEEYKDALDLDGPLEVLDPKHCDNAVVVDKLDESYLSLDFLKLYIESTFADGRDVVLDCKVIPENSWTIIVFKEPKVVTLVLRNQDHIPLPSVNYHIKIKPLYTKFHCPEDPVQQMVLSQKSVSIKGNVKFENNSCFPNKSKASSISNKTSRNEVINEVPERETVEETVIPDGNKGVDAEESSIKVDKETIDFSKIQKLKYKLLEDKLTSDFKVKYIKNEKKLYIYGTDPTKSKGEILDLLRTVNTSRANLNKKEVELLKGRKVNDYVKNIDEFKESLFDVDDSLTVFSLGNSDEQLAILRQRLLYTKSFRLPKNLSIETVRGWNKEYNNDMMMMKYNDDSITLTGVVEDVTLAADSIKQILDNWQDVLDKFQITGKAAIFVKRFGMYRLESIFQDACIIKKKESEEEICFQFTCKKFRMKDLQQKLKKFKESIRISEMDFNDLCKVDHTLVRRNLKKDHEIIENFQKSNHCCVFVDNFKGTENLGASPASKKDKEETFGSKHNSKSSGVPEFHKKKNRVKHLSSCKLKVKPRGNITKERADLLVCGVDSTLNLNKTKVSQTFGKLDGSLQNQISDYNFSPNGVYIDQRHIPNTKCKAIAFITLQAWQQGISGQRLQAAVLEVLERAMKMGMRSVSIPPLGFGRAHKFPEKEAAQSVITAINTFLNANPTNLLIKSINCLASDELLYNAMNKEIDAVFKEEMTNDTSCPDNDEDDDSGDDDNDDDELTGGDREERNGAKAFQNSREEENESPELPVSMVIVHSETEKEDLVTMLKKEMVKVWLHVGYYKLEKITCCSPIFFDEMVQSARCLGLLLSKVKGPSSKGLHFEIKGQINDVEKMKSIISEKVMAYQKDLLSPLAPVRSTLDFIKFAADCHDAIPSYWSQITKGTPGSRHDQGMVNIDPTFSKAISDLVYGCWDQNLVGHGHDANNIPFNSTIKVIKVQRLENHSLFKKYSSRRRAIFEEMSKRNQLCTSIGNVTKSKGCTKTMKYVPNFMSKELYHEINELYLLHGTKSDIIPSIRHQGVDNRLSNDGAMFGKGVYMAESSTKSDQYADSRSSRVPHGTNLTMILTRVTLGDVFLCDDKHESVQSRQCSTKLRRPPCTKCLKDACNPSCGAPLFHSVMGDGKWLFREFVVYDHHQCYPEYFITYQRCQKS